MTPSAPYPLFPIPDALAGKDQRYWTHREGKEFFNIVLGALDERVEGLLAYFEEDASASPEELLTRLGGKVAEVLPSDQFSGPPQTEPDIVVKRGKTYELPPLEGRTLTEQGEAVARDMGLLLAKLMLERGHPPLEWSIVMKPKNDADYLQPILVRTDRKNPLPFDPMGSSLAVAYQILRGNCEFDKWAKMYTDSVKRYWREMPE